MKIACTGYVSEQTGSVAAANSLLLRALLDRGVEVDFFSKHFGCEIIGTDISETASQFSHMVQWDFHEENPDWIGKFDFVYTNSLDQAFDPEKALGAWARQLTPTGLIFIEHTKWHAADAAGEMDPFGAHPMLMPYLLLDWGRNKYRPIDIIHVDNSDVLKGQTWVFVVAPVTA